MNLFKYTFISFVAIACFLVSCTSSKTGSVDNGEEIFSLNTTSCLGPCPVFELSLYGNKVLVFKGEENTSLTGEHKKKLTDDQFEALTDIIESADWVNLEEDYRVQMSDLPTQKYTYNRNGISKRVSRYGGGPESLQNLSDIILTFVEEQVFDK